MATWKYWDATALVFGAVPLVVLGLFYSGATPASFNTLLLILSLLIYPIAALVSWRQGDYRLAATGGILLILAIVIASPLILLLTACLMGDCI
ncbi:MAG: hypothetical protein Q7T60_16155 [Sphingopyxis sp.]|nr:hypothetical protein [Sphingopyxis sp.]